MNKLVAALDDYIKLLICEINDLVGVAHVHGWKSNRVKMGTMLRKRIEKARKAAKTDQAGKDVP